jgi:hypothetical protein
VTGEIATIEIVTRSETEDTGHDRQKGIETETGTGTETDMLERDVSVVDGAMSYEIETESGIGNLREEGEKGRGGTETIGTLGVVGEGGEIGIENKGIGNDLEKRMTVGGLQEVEARHGM